MGPSATPMPAVPDQSPMARARSRSMVKTLVRIDKVQGIRHAAPTPMMARASVKRSGVPAHAAKAEPPPNTTKPPRKMGLRPTRSPSAPRDNRRPANTTA